MRPMRERSSLRICHVLWSVELGGAERVVLDLARAQVEAGHAVHVVVLKDADGALAEDFRRTTKTLDVVPKWGGTDPTLPLRLSRWFRAHAIDVVHTHNELPLIYGAPGGKLARAVVVHSKHGVVAVNARAHLLRKAAARAVDAFVAVSEATAKTALDGGECSSRQLRVVVNGTDLSRFPAPPSARAEVRRALGIPEDAEVVVTVGRLVKEKNQALLLRAVAPLLGESRRLVLVGDGVLRAELEAQARALPNGRFVVFAGARKDVPAVLAASDVFALSSDTEGLPIGLLEAWAAGLPVVSTAVGGIPDVVREGETGWLVPPGDEAALRAAIARALEGGAAVAHVAEAARSHVLAAYSSGAMAEAYEALYRSFMRA